MEKFKSAGPSSIIVIILTVVLFGMALFFKGFTHDLLLEAGVFLVSLKLILITHQNAKVANRLEAHLVKIEDLLARPAPADSELKEQQQR